MARPKPPAGAAPSEGAAADGFPAADLFCCTRAAGFYRAARHRNIRCSLREFRRDIILIDQAQQFYGGQSIDALAEDRDAKEVAIINALAAVGGGKG